MFCECGCGNLAPICRHTNRRRGQVAGKPVRFIYGHKGPDRQDPDKSYEVEIETGCWIWKRWKSDLGYGQMTEADGNRTSAHRWFYERAYGPVADDLVVDHLCRRPSCVNPSHLEPVTVAENWRRGKGAKVTVAKAKEIKSLLRQGLRCSVIARRFGVSRRTVSFIKHGATWKDA